MEEGQVVENQVESPAVEKPQEKMIPQSRVEQLLHERTKDVAAKSRAQALEDAKQLYQSPSPVQQPQQSMGGMSQMSPDELSRMISESVQKNLETERTRHVEAQKQQDAHRIVSEFQNKIAASDHPDLMKRLQDLGLGNIPHIVELANGMENTADIMHELEQNPAKIGNLTSLLYTHPQLAIREMQRLSHSIKANKDASNHQSANEPLDRMSASVTKTDNGQMSDADLRSQDWMRA